MGRMSLQNPKSQFSGSIFAKSLEFMRQQVQMLRPQIVLCRRV